MKKHSESGFTLLEMMIVVTIIGILSAIAIPNYRDYVRRTRNEATSAMSGDIAKFLLQCWIKGGKTSTETVRLNNTVWKRIICTDRRGRKTYFYIKIEYYDFKLSDQSFAIKGIGGSEAFCYKDGLTPEPIPVESELSEETAETACLPLETQPLVIEQTAE
uniref:type IV pilin protein n=1 Tax=Candidatus Electronema sp. TaxID=2698783 RepID=UPI00405777EF